MIKCTMRSCAELLPWRTLKRNATGTATPSMMSRFLFTPLQSPYCRRSVCDGSQRDTPRELFVFLTRTQTNRGCQNGS
jgi:hypothetical protein